MKNSLATIARGFLFGVGLCIAALCAYFVADRLFFAKDKDSYFDGRDEQSEAMRKSIVLSNLEERKSDGAFAIIGSVKNTGKVPARGIQIAVDLFQKGRFVDQYSTYVSGTLAPGEERNFKISCGCKDTPPAEHDSYKVQILGGY